MLGADQRRRRGRPARGRRPRRRGTGRRSPARRRRARTGRAAGSRVVATTPRSRVSSIPTSPGRHSTAKPSSRSRRRPGGDVVGREPHLGASRQRAALAAGLLAAEVDEDRLALGRGVELEHGRRVEAARDPAPEPARHAGADEQAHGMVVLGGVLRRVGDLAQHRPRVGGDRDPVAAHLLPERRRVEVARDREPRAARDRAAHAHQQPGGVVDRGDGVDGVGVGERRRRRGRERRQRPAAVGEAVRPRPLALAGEQDEGEVGGAARVGAIPGGRLDQVRVDPLHVDDLAAEVAVLSAAAEHEDLASRRRRAAWPASSGSATIRVTWPSSASRATGPSGRISTATAPSRLSAATTERPLGRVLISTPTCSPWRTPSESRPRTTLSMRRLTASCG